MEKIIWNYSVRNEEVLHKVKEDRSILHKTKTKQKKTRRVI
jgi:hypothetical protein